MSKISLEVTPEEAHEMRVALSCAIFELERDINGADYDEIKEYEARIKVMSDLLDMIPTGIF